MAKNKNFEEGKEDELDLDEEPDKEELDEAAVDGFGDDDEDNPDDDQDEPEDPN